MLSYDLFAVVKDGMYLSNDSVLHKYFYCANIAMAQLISTLEYAEILAQEHDGTVHQVTIVSVPLLEAMEK